MTPEICLGMKLPEVLATHEKICTLADKKYKEFLAAYDGILEIYPECAEQIARLLERVAYAYELCTERHTQRPTCGFISHDEAYYEWIDEIHAEEDAGLDGDFPLGRERDASFANHFFDTEELAYIQLGIFHMLVSGPCSDESERVLTRKGFICELYGDWELAVNYYEGVDDRLVDEREKYCREKMYAEGKRCYEEAQELMGKGNFDSVSTLLYRAADMKYTDAMTDLALALIYGQFGVQKNADEALRLLREASGLDCERACFELVELYDNGFAAVEGAEAQQMCEKAARLGNKRAEQRLPRGFDTRPYTDILAQRVEDGDIASGWALVQIYSERGEYELASKWLDRCIEAGYPEALVDAARVYLDRDGELYNESLAEQYLRRAANAGDVGAIIMLGGLELKDTDKHFWQAVRTLESEGRPEGKIFEQHLREFGWYKLASDAGDVSAMEHVLTAYLFGYPVEQDYALAYTWAHKASEQSSHVAMYTEAYLLENGFGTDRDIDRALSIYAESAEGGIISSMLRLYEIYRDGLEHIAPDGQKSMRYLWMSGYGRS